MKKQVSKKEDSKIFAFIAVFLSVIGFLIALIFKKEDKYVMFYAKQSLILFITIIIVSVTGIIPIIGEIIKIIGTIFVIILWVIQLINSLSGEIKYTPFIGDFAKKIDL